MKTSGGFFKDKAAVGFNSITGDKIDVSLIKATSTTLEAPREKYVQHLISATKFGNKGKFVKEGKPLDNYLITDLRKRTHSHNWVVVLKAYIVLHRLAMDGSLNFNQALDTSIFNYMTIKNLEKTTQGARHKLFIMQYVSYLRARTSISNTADVGWRLEEDRSDIELRHQTIDALLNAIDNFLEIPFREDTVDNFASLEAYRLLIIDGKNLYRQLSLRILDMINQFPDQSLSSQKKYRQLYVRYDSAVGILKNFFDLLRSSSLIFREPIPALRPLPVSVPQLLDEIMEAKRAEQQGTDPSPSVSGLPSRRTALNVEDERLAQLEEDMLQEVLRKSAEEAGVPYNNGETNPGTDTPPQEPKRGAPTAVGEESAEEEKNYKEKNIEKKDKSPDAKPVMPKFSLDDLFDVTAPQENLQPVHYHDPLALQQPSGVLNSAMSTNASDADWETGIPESNMSSLARPKEEEEWDTGVPVSQPMDSFDNWNSGAPSSDVHPPLFTDQGGAESRQPPINLSMPMKHTPQSANVGNLFPQQNQGFGGSPQQHQGFGSSPQQNQMFGSSPQQHQGFGGSSQQNQMFGSSPQQHQGFGGSSQQNQMFGSSPQQHQGFGSSPQQNQMFGSSPQQHQGFGGSPQQNQMFGSSPQQHQGFGGSSQQNQMFGSSPQQQHVGALSQQRSWDSGAPSQNSPPNGGHSIQFNELNSLFAHPSEQPPAPTIRRKNNAVDDPFMSLFEAAKKH